MCAVCRGRAGVAGRWWWRTAWFKTGAGWQKLQSREESRLKARCASRGAPSTVQVVPAAGGYHGRCKGGRKRHREC